MAERRKMRGLRGLTLIELMAVMAIIALSLTFALPAARSLLGAAGRRGAVSIVLGTFEQGRAVALSEGVPVYVLFADSDAPAKDYRQRAMALVAEDVEGELRYVSEWRFLPEGILFKNEPSSVFGSADGLRVPFPRSEGMSAEFPYVKFDSLGIVEAPESSKLRLFLFEGFFDEGGRERRAEGKSDLFFDQISISKFTGRARWMTPDE